MKYEIIYGSHGYTQVKLYEVWDLKQVVYRMILYKEDTATVKFHKPQRQKQKSRGKEVQVAQTMDIP